MDELKLRTALVVGTANPRAWSQVHSVHIPNGEIIVLVAVSYGGESDIIDLSEIGGSLIDNLTEKRAFLPKDLTELGEGFGKTVIMAIVEHDQLQICGVGDAEIYLMRENKIGKIFSGRAEIATINGNIRQGDKLVVATREVVRILGLEKIGAVLKNGVSEAENLAVTVHGSEDSSLMAALYAEVERGGESETSDQIAVRSGQESKDWIRTWLNKISWQRPIKINQEKKKWNLMIGLGLIVLLFLGIVSGMVQRSRMVKERALSQLTTSATQKMQEAKSIGDLNPERAKHLLTQVKGEVDQYLASTEDMKYQDRAKELQVELTKVETEVFKKQDVTISTLTELSLLQPGLAADKMFLAEAGNILIPDVTAARILGMNVVDKSKFEIELGEMGRVKEIGMYNKKGYAIVDGGIAELTPQPKIVIEPDDLWGEITLIDLYGGNVYLLDKGQSEIWKYPALTEGFGTRRRWLGAGIELDLTKVVDMKVDGDIWIVTSTGKLERYSRGVPIIFAMEGFPAVETGKLVQPVALYLTETEVYVLENGPGRVVVFDKESGKYVRQYGAEVMREGKDLVVYEDKAYVLLSDKIVWFQL